LKGDIMETYIVKKGDTLDTIAKSYNVKVGDIINANGLMMPYILLEGQTLIIPIDDSTVYDYYKVKQGDTLYNIAVKYNTTVPMIASINGIKQTDYIYPGQIILVPKSNIKTYITKAGDTLSSVANYFKVSNQKIITDNKGIYLLPEQLIIVKANTRY